MRFNYGMIGVILFGIGFWIVVGVLLWRIL